VSINFVQVLIFRCL